MTAQHPRVLTVGHCDYDHGNLARLLAEQFHAEVERATDSESALNAARTRIYDLLLDNRVFDGSGVEGLEFIRRLRAEDATRCTPVMLVSNYPEAQDAAEALGARRGFGKNALDQPDTVALLRRYLRKE
ncbi:MAG: hypothetical protein HY763_13955 [Planctomycetes bacterium]|nr:hypothetical protein [Planctomycetota bacterium]